MKHIATFFLFGSFLLLSGFMQAQESDNSLNLPQESSKPAFQLDLTLEMLTPEVFRHNPMIGKFEEEPTLLNNALLAGEVDLTFRLKNTGVDTVLKDSLAYGYIELDTERNPIDTVMSYYEWTGVLEPDSSVIIKPGSIVVEEQTRYEIGGWSFSPNDQLDDYPFSDTTGGEFFTYSAGQLIEDFDGKTFAPDGWQVDGNWSDDMPILMRRKFPAGQFPVVAQDAQDAPANLITPSVHIDENHNQLLFDLFGAENETGGLDKSEEGNSFLAVKYTQEISGGWETLITFDMSVEGDQVQVKKVDLSPIPEGDYYLAFHAYSTFDGTNFIGGTLVGVDNVMGPPLTDATSTDLAVEEVDFIREFVKSGEDTISITTSIKNTGIETQSGASFDYTLDEEVIGTGTVPELAYNEVFSDTLEYVVPQTSGIHHIGVTLEADDNPENNSKSFETLFYDETMNTFGFESGIPPGWYPERTPAAGWQVISEPDYSYEGSQFAACGSNPEPNKEGTKAGPYENVRLIADQFRVSPGNSTLYFAARRMHVLDPNSEEESTLQIEYSRDRSGSWSELGEEIVLTNKWTLYKIDLSSLPEDEYIFAFSASSEYYNPSFDVSGHVMLDFVHTPEYGKPEVYRLEPGEGRIGVDTNDYVAALFYGELDSLDFSGIKIENSVGEEVSGVYAEINLPYKFIGPSIKALQIYHDPFKLMGEEYTVTIPKNAVTRDGGSLGNDSIQWSFVTDQAPPEVTYLYPDTFAAGVTLDSKVYARFDKKVRINNAGGISIHSVKNNGNLYNVTAALSEDQQTVELTYDSLFHQEDTLTVNFVANSIQNKDYIGMSDTSWVFYTLQADEPVAESLLPAPASNGVAADAAVEMRFDRAVTVTGDLSSITIEGHTQGNVTGVTGTLVEDSILIISHDAFQNYHETYVVTIPEGIVESNSGNIPNSQIKWYFTTVMEAPSVTSISPEDGETAVPVDFTEIKVEFDQDIFKRDIAYDSIVTILDSNNDKVNPDYIGRSNNRLYIRKFSNYKYHETYSVTIHPGMLFNVDSVFNEEITFQFTTIMSAPLAASYTPSYGKMDVPLDADISVTFDQDVTVNGLSGVTITSDQKGEVPGVSATLADDNRTVNITHGGLFTANNDRYLVLIPYNALENADKVANREALLEFYTIATYDIIFEINDGSAPLADVSVTLGDETQATDTAGKAIYPAITEGQTFDYVIAKSGYDSISGYVVVDDHKTLNYTLKEEEVVTGIEDSQERTLQVYPNPSVGKIHIDFASDVQNAALIIRDITGKAVFETSLKDQRNTIDLYDYPEGIYFIEIRKNKKVMNSKFILQ